MRQKSILIALLVGSLFTGIGPGPSGIAPRLSVAAEPETAFHGWQGLRVIQQEGYPSRMTSADLDGTGRQTLIVVNTRQSRLDLYQWMPVDKREKPKEKDLERPNELPMAPEFKRVEVPMDQLPLDAMVADIDGDGKTEIVLLTGPIPRVAIYRKAADKPGGWAKGETWDLLPGQIGVTRKPALLRRPEGKGPWELLVSFSDGIQSVVLAKGERPRWVTPREKKGRFWWDIADLRGNGGQDLVEVPQQSGRALIRWYPSKAGQLLPAISLGEEPSLVIEMFKPPGQQSEVLAVDGKTPGILRRYKLNSGEKSPIGDKLTLPLASGASGNWTGVTIEKRPTIVWIDPDQPMLRLARLSDNGWENEESFPGVTNMTSLQPMPGQQGVLILARDASELLESKWENGRLTYPKPVTFSPPVEGQARKILGMGRVGSQVWWIQKAGDDLLVHRWAPGQEKPEVEKFVKAGSKADAALPVGPGRLLIKEQYAQGLKLLIRGEGDNVQSEEPSNLAQAELGSYQLVKVGDQVKLARLVDGAMQWIGNDMQPADQIMLGDGQKLSSYVPRADGSALALQQDGAFIYLMKPDKAGVPRIAEAYRCGGGAALVEDPVLGLILIDGDKLSRLAPGKPAELALVDSFDGRDSRPGGTSEPGFSRIATVQLTRKDRQDVLLINDIKHEVTLLRVDEKAFKFLMTWQIFDDSSYPYGGGAEGFKGAPEPRVFVALDFDGNGLPDLAMLCHDRLLIYLARDKK